MQIFKICFANLAVLAAWFFCSSLANLGARQQILNELSRLYFSYDTKPIYVLKNNAEAIAWSSNGQFPFVTASQIGKGRVIIFASWNFFIDMNTNSSMYDLYQRFVKWASNGKTSTSTDKYQLKTQLSTANGTFNIFTHKMQYSATEMNQLIAAIKDGRVNLIISIPYINNEREYLRPLLKEAGVYISSDVDTTSDKWVDVSVNDLINCPIDSIQTTFPKLASASDSYFMCSAAHTFAALAKVPLSELKEVGVSQSEYIRIVNARKQHAEKYVPTIKTPIKTSTDKKWAVIYNNMFLVNDFLVNSNITAPKINEYPGDIEINKAKIVNVEITIDARVVDEIHATGYYLPAGSTATVEVLQNGGNMTGWSILIGCWTDTPFRRDAWTRYPIIHQKHKFESKKIFSAFGGSIQVKNDKDTRGIVKLRLSGVIEAPYFNLRDPKSISDWNSRLSRSASPWTDMIGDMISYCIPTSLIKDKTSSDVEYMVKNVWDNVVKTQFEFVGEDWKQTRRERIVMDILPSYGYGHAGYPIIAWQDDEWGLSAVSRDYAFKTGAWGTCHELGHNRQNHGFTWSATVETTNNILSLMNRDLIFHLPSFEANMVAWDGGRMREITQHIRNGAPYSKWSSDAWMALAIYDQFAKHFGWGIISQWFHTYTQTMKNNRPEKDQDVIDQWADRMITITEMNLMPLFDFWNIPVSQFVVTKASKFPCFLPLDWMTSLDNKSRYNVIDKKYGGKCERSAKKTVQYTKTADLKAYHALDVNATPVRG